MKKLIYLALICILFSSCFSVKEYYYRYELEVTFQNGEIEDLEYGGVISLIKGSKQPFFFISNGDLCFETEDNRQVIASGVRKYNLIRKIKVEVK